MLKHSVLLCFDVLHGGAIWSYSLASSLETVPCVHRTVGALPTAARLVYTHSKCQSPYSDLRDPLRSIPLCALTLSLPWFSFFNSYTGLFVIAYISQAWCLLFLQSLQACFPNWDRIVFLFWVLLFLMPLTLPLFLPTKPWFLVLFRLFSFLLGFLGCLSPFADTHKVAIDV